MKANPLQFAVVREDPRIEAELVRRFDARRVLLVASGGCTALELKTLFPQAEVTLFDLNLHQLAHVQRKVEAMGSPERFNVGDSDPAGLNACGNFESLFRGFSGFVKEMILDEVELIRLLESGRAETETLDSLFSNRYWRVAFDLFFSESILLAMFGPDAITHAPPGSYPIYFQKALERGLRSPTRAHNYFLHHLFLGRYFPRAEALPRYLTSGLTPHRYEFQYVHGPIESVPALESFDLIALSNLFDWMPLAEVERTAALLVDKTKAGCTLVFRQLNHASRFERYFGPRVTFDAELADRLNAEDRSLFYSRVCVGRRGLE